MSPGKTAAERQKQYREKLKRENPEKYKIIKSQTAARALEHYRKKLKRLTEKQDLLSKLQDSIKDKTVSATGDTLQKQWKNAREAQTSTAQSAKLNERHQFWAQSKPTCFRPHVDIPKSDSDKPIVAEEANVSRSPNITLNNTAQPQVNDRCPSQNDTHRSRRGSNLDQTQSQDNVINLTDLNRDEDDTDLLFKSYAKKLKTMAKRRQATVKFEIAKLMMKAELEECDELRSLNNEQLLENNMVMIIEQPANRSGLDTNDTFIKSSPPPVSDNDYPLLTLPTISSCHRI